jgi:hypothetical protein
MQCFLYSTWNLQNKIVNSKTLATLAQIILFLEMSKISKKPPLFSKGIFFDERKRRIF